VHPAGARDARSGFTRTRGARSLVGESQRGATSARAGRRAVGRGPAVRRHSRERDQAYFCEGIAEEITNALSRVEGLRVASRTSAFLFRPGSADSRRFRAGCASGPLLEGSVRKSGDHLRIAVQLGDAQTGFPARAARYDREISDIYRRPGRDRAAPSSLRCGWR